MKYTSRTICYFILVGFVLVGLVWGFWGLLLYHVVCGFAASIVLSALARRMHPLISLFSICYIEYKAGASG